MRVLVTAIAAVALWRVALFPAAGAAETTVLDFENPEHAALFAREAHPAAAVVAERPSQGSRCLRLVFEKHEAGKGEWPGVSFSMAAVGAPTDWSRYVALLVDVATANPAGSEIGFTLAGPEGAKTWYSYAPVPAGKWSTLRFPMTDVGAQMDVSDVRRMGILMRRPPEATTLFVDHIRLERWSLTDPEAFEAFLICPAQNASFYHSNPETDVEVGLRLRAPREEWRDTRLRLTLSSPDGKVLGTAEASGEQSGALVTLRLPRPALRDNETATARVDVLRAGARVRGEEFRITQRPPAPEEVCLRRDGTLLVNGKPFFPFGMYQSPVAEFTTLKQMGFNTVHTYTPADAAYLEAAAKAGLRVISAVKGTYSQPPHYHEPLWREEEVAAHVRAVKDSPALLAHYLYDEPSPTHTPPARLRELCDIARRADAYHPVAGCNNSYQFAYRRVADVMMVDSYPIPGSLANLIARTREGAEAQEPGLALWFIPQAFPWEPYFRVARPTPPFFNSERLPTFDEVRTMPWVALALGAKGLVYYSWQVQGFAIRDAYPVFWKGFTYHVAETAALLPWLSEPVPEQPARCDDAAVFVTTRHRRGEILVAAANSTAEKKDVTVTVPGLAGRAVHFVSEEVSAQPEGDRVHLSLAPMETRILVTAREGLPPLTPLARIRAELGRLEREFQAANPSLCTVQQGATLDASWGFPKPGEVRFAPWYRMIDGWPGTPWVVGQTFRSESWSGFPAEKLAAAGRWIEVRLPRPERVNTVRAIASPWAALQVQVFASGAWRDMATEQQADAMPRHPGHPSATFTARFEPLEIDRFRVVFPKPKTQAETVFELSAFLTP